jgi:cathepsin L
VRSYAFATATAVETWGAIRAGSTSPPDSLSVQQILDCSGSSGCAGGTIPATLAYAAASGLCAARDYAYVGYQTACRACSAVIKPSAYAQVDCCDDAALEAAVRETPVVVAICSAGQAFQSCEFAARPAARRAQLAPTISLPSA